MKDSVLVDTCIWIDFFRQNSEIESILLTLISEKKVCICGIVLFELLQGIKSQEEKNLIKSSFSGLTYIEMKPFIWEKSADLSYLLKKQGLNIPLSDILIATIVREYELSILTIDRHFEQIPDVKLFNIS